MFEGLQGKLEKTFRWLTGFGTLSRTNIDDALREVRASLLDADVHHAVVESFLASLAAKVVGREVQESFSPGQQFIKIVRDEIIATLGAPASPALSGPRPAVIMLIGLQGAGKTTTAAKLARHLAEVAKRHPCLAAADLKRPAAVEQLAVLGRTLGIPCLTPSAGEDVLSFVSRIRTTANDLAYDTVILDTAGRLHTDAEMMEELRIVRDRVSPGDTLLVLDAMAGQDAVRVAQEFASSIGFSGAILTKADGDARGGAALSLRAVTGKPILYVGMGEKVDALEVFHPDRMASRIIGMGDMLSLIEKAESRIGADDRERAEEVLRKGGDFTLDDFLTQLRMVKKMGSLGDMLSMIPGMSRAGVDPRQVKAAEGELKKSEAIINSMTAREKQRPEIINGSRRLRIARGSGTKVEDVNRLMKKFMQAKKLMKQVSRSGLRGLSGLGGRYYGG